MSTRADIKKKFSNLDTKLRSSIARANGRFNADLKLLQEECQKSVGHDYEWTQIAGEGKICKLCQYHDWSDD